MLIDSHVHLQTRAFAGDLPQVVRRAHDAGIWQMVCIADGVESAEAAVRLAQRVRGIHATAGVHPHNDHLWSDGDLDRLRILAKDPSIVAIGEIGIDYHYPDFDKTRQHHVFISQAQLASELELPMVIHCRDAYADLIKILTNETSITARGIVHCFAGDIAQARALIDLGFHLGFGGALTYPGSEMMRDVLADVGLERVVLETDGPYLPPQDKRGRRNESSYLRSTIEEVCRVTGKSWHEVANITSRNTRALYALPELNRGDVLDSPKNVVSFTSAEEVADAAGKLRARGEAVRVRVPAEAGMLKALSAPQQTGLLGMIDTIEFEFTGTDLSGNWKQLAANVEAAKPWIPAVAVLCGISPVTDVADIRNAVEADLKVRLILEEASEGIAE